MAWWKALLGFLSALLAHPTAPPAPTPEPMPEPTPEPVLEPVQPPVPTPREHLYDIAKSCLGKDITPADEVPDHVACVAQLQEVIYRATGALVGKGSARSNTLAFRKALDADARFEKIELDAVLPGDIVVACTGEGSGHGHCWIVGFNHWMSNTSANGHWEPNYTKPAVLLYFVKQRGFPLHCYRLISK